MSGVKKTVSKNSRLEKTHSSQGSDNVGRCEAFLRKSVSGSVGGGVCRESPICDWQIARAWAIRLAQLRAPLAQPPPHPTPDNDQKPFGGTPGEPPDGHGDNRTCEPCENKPRDSHGVHFPSGTGVLAAVQVVGTEEVTRKMDRGAGEAQGRVGEPASLPPTPPGPPLGISVHIPGGYDRGGSISLYGRGVVTCRRGSVLQRKSGHDREKRGCIKGWSAHSRHRLRMILATTLPPKGWQGCNVTLTVPGPELTPGEWRKMTETFWRKLEEKGLLAIWRVELQQRGQAHIHAVVCGRSKRACEEVKLLWNDALSELGPVRDYEWTNCYGRVRKIEFASSRTALPGSDRHAIDVKHDDGTNAWYRYMCDHASKTKQAQMGWNGRQWGIRGRKLLRQASPWGSYSLEGKAWFHAMRALRRLTRSFKFRGSHGNSVWFSAPATVKRICEWAQNEYGDVVPF